MKNKNNSNKFLAIGLSIGFALLAGCLFFVSQMASVNLGGSQVSNVSLSVDSIGSYRSTMAGTGATKQYERVTTIRAGDLYLRAKSKDDLKSAWITGEPVYLIRSQSKFFPILKRDWLCLTPDYGNNCAKVVKLEYKNGQ